MAETTPTTPTPPTAPQPVSDTSGAPIPPTAPTDPAKPKFDENSKLGFLRFIQFICVMQIALNLFIMIFITGSTVTFSFGAVSSVLSICMMAATVWLIGNRKEYARQIVSALCVADYLIGLLSTAIYDSLNLDYILTSAIPTVLTVLYLMTSRRAKAVLVRPFAPMTLEEEQRAQNRRMWNLRSKDFWLRMILYFFIFSVVGHWMEAGFCTLVKLGIAPGNYNPDGIQFRDSLNPFYIYGIAFSLCGVLLYPLKEYAYEKFNRKLIPTLLVSALATFAFVVAAELVLGFLVNREYSVWDYRNQPVNFMGQVCLVYSLLFTIVAMVVTWAIFPALERLLSHVNRDAFRVIFAVSLVLFLLLVVTYSIDLDTLAPGSGLSYDMNTLEPTDPAAETSGVSATGASDSAATA